MNQVVWISLGLVATVLTVGVGYGGKSQKISPEAGIIGSAFGVFLWAVFVINSYTVHTVADNGEIVTQSYSSIGMLGAAASAVCIYILVRGVLEQADLEAL